MYKVSIRVYDTFVSVDRFALNRRFRKHGFTVLPVPAVLSHFFIHALIHTPYGNPRTVASIHVRYDRGDESDRQPNP